VDIAKAVTHISLCTGYGGIDLGLRRAVRDLRTIAYSEINEFAAENLVAKIESGLLDVAPIWTDLKTFPFKSFRGRVDILSGGYPCQPFSSAGLQRGVEDERHLWPYIAAGIDAMQPAICFFENVEGHINIGLRDVINGLASRGYQAAWGIFSAAEIGAPHQRNRVFILAYNLRARLQKYVRRQQLGSELRARSPEHFAKLPEIDRARTTRIDAQRSQEKAASGGRRISNQECNEQNKRQSLAEALLKPATDSAIYAFPAQPNERQREYEPPRIISYAKSFRDNNNPDSANSDGELPEPRNSASARRSRSFRQKDKSTLGRESYGHSDRLGNAELYTTVQSFEDEMRLLGNGVVPAVAELAFRTLLQEISDRH
jgi:site-specific DNA-cytosine methylase